LPRVHAMLESLHNALAKIALVSPEMLDEMI
jgi:hypothetical protein